MKPCSTCSSTDTDGIGQECPVTQVEPELAVSMADEVEYGQALFLFVQPQAAAELLEEDRQALGRAEEKHRVDLGDVDALVVQVDDEQDVHFPTAQAVLGRVAVGPRRVSAERASAGIPASRNLTAMYSAWATLTQKPSARAFRGSSRIERTFVDHKGGSQVIAGEDPVELIDPVAAALPFEAAAGLRCRSQRSTGTARAACG